MSEVIREEMDEPATEKQDERFANIDRISVSELVTLINQADQEVAFAVGKSNSQISTAVAAISQAFNAGARLIYVGAGTSGRIATLDASEILPTFGVANRVIALMAGGPSALVNPQEGAEDDVSSAETDLKFVRASSNDVVIGVASSGSTPYVQSALEYANSIGALTVAISCNRGSIISDIASHSIEVVVGPEVIAGSSRLKAGTAQKMVLNMISTITMIRAGKTYKNLMVDMVASNKKLRTRAIGMVQTITGADESVATSALQEHNWSAKQAVVGIQLGLGKVDSAKALAEAGGVLAKALGEIK
jgi:N-acetylmuramic acid 6-phosphate etherase